MILDMDTLYRIYSNEHSRYVTVRAHQHRHRPAPTPLANAQETIDFSLTLMRHSKCIILNLYDYICIHWRRDAPGGRGGARGANDAVAPTGGAAGQKRPAGHLKDLPPPCLRGLHQAFLFFSHWSYFTLLFVNCQYNNNAFGMPERHR